MTIPSGIMSAMGRLIKLFVTSVFGLMRLDQSLYPRWVAEIVNLDAGNQAYLGMVYMYHMHNHPIHITAASIWGKYKLGFI